MICFILSQCRHHKNWLMVFGLVIRFLKSKKVLLDIKLIVPEPSTSRSLLKGFLLFASSVEQPCFSSLCSQINFFGRCTLLYSSISLSSIAIFSPKIALPLAMRCSGTTWDSSMIFPCFIYFFVRLAPKILSNSFSYSI